MKLNGFISNIKTPLLMDTTKYAISKGVPGIIGLASVWCFANLLGSEGYGQFAIVFSIANMSAVFSSGWIQQSLLRFYTAYENERYLMLRATMNGICAALAIGSLIILSIGVMGYYSDKARAFEPIAVLAVWGLFFCLVIQMCLIAIYQAKVEPGQVVKIEILRSILIFIVPLTMIVAVKASYLSLVGGIVLGNLVVFAWMRRSIKGLYRHVVTQGQAKETTGKIFFVFLRYGFPLSLWLAVMSAFPVVDRFFIRYYYDFSETGIYASIYDIVIRSFSLFLFPVVMAAHPRIMKAWNSGNPHEARKLIQSAIITQCLIFGVVFLAYLAFADQILIALFQQTSHRLKMVIVTLVIGGFLWQLALTVHKPFEVKQRTWMMVFGIIISLVVTSCINLIFLPKLGLVASGIALIASAICYLTICSFQYRNLFNPVDRDS